MNRFYKKDIHALGLFILALVCLPAVAGSHPANPEQTIVLGIQEDVPGVYAGEPHSFAVRVAFQKHGKEWQAFPTCQNQYCLKTISDQYPREVTWNISLGGRKLGLITGRTKNEFKFYSHIGLQDVKSGHPPSVGKPSTEYSGFLSEPVYRPLLANTRPYFSNPDSWVVSELSGRVVRLLRREFRKRAPSVSNCANAEENVATPWDYKDEDIKIIKAYSSVKGWFLARLRLGEYKCDGPADDSFIDQWYLISSRYEISFLDAGMWLVDVGDFDNDEEEEFLFSIDRDDRGGYELFYDNFTKSSTFEYYYH